MIQVEHKTEKGTVLFVRVPDGAYNLSNNMQRNQLDYYIDTPFNGSKLTFSECIILPKVDWQLIGLTSEVEEDQAKMMLPTEKERHPDLNLYINYTEESTRYAYLLKKALDSFKSLMQHLQVYEVNPLDKTNPVKYMRNLITKTKVRVPNEEYGKWKESESRTGKWVVLFKEN